MTPLSPRPWRGNPEARRRARSNAQAITQHHVFQLVLAAFLAGAFVARFQCSATPASWHGKLDVGTMQLSSLLDTPFHAQQAGRSRGSTGSTFLKSERATSIFETENVGQSCQRLRSNT